MNKTTDSALLGESKSQLEPFVELRFPVRGSTLPADHNYALYAAVVRCVPDVRHQFDISILSIPGFGDRQGKILLTPQSCMRIRVPISKIPLVYSLAGKQVKLGTHTIQFGIPETGMLTPAQTLQARIVTIKGFVEPQSFIEAVNRQLNSLGISGTVKIPADRNGNPLRKTIKVQRFTVIGFTTEINNLGEQDSLILQQYGVGGKRHMGCGYFLPFTGGSND